MRSARSERIRQDESATTGVDSDIAEARDFVNGRINPIYKA
jgi:hypothetical protein